MSAVDQTPRTRRAPGGKGALREYETVSGLESRLNSDSQTQPSERHGRHSERRDLWLADRVLLDETLSPGAKLVAAEIARTPGRLSYKEIAAVLPMRHTHVKEAIRELLNARIITVLSHASTLGIGNGARGAKYRLADSAYPGARNRYTKLSLALDLPAAPARWVLYALFLREQARTGAVQMPDALAARIARTSTTNVSAARVAWNLTQIHPRRGRTTPAAYVMDSATYPPRPERFQPDQRRIEQRGNLRAWGTTKQLARIEHLLDADASKAEGLPIAPEILDADQTIRHLSAVADIPE